MLNTDLVLCRYICFALRPAHTRETDSGMAYSITIAEQLQ